MHIGVPRERKTLEKRVALTPDGARELIKHGHTVLVETQAGVCSSFADNDYEFVGCRIIKTLAEVWQNSELVVKVKEPDESEFKFFRDDLVLFDFLHLASLPAVAKALLEKKVTAFAYETVQTSDGRLPLLEPMSEIAGKLSIQNGAYFLLSQNGGRGVLLGGAIGVPAAKVVVIGAGIAGRNACAAAIGMGAQVTLMDISAQKLEAVASRFGPAVRTVYSTRSSIEREVENADLLIGAVLIPGAATPRLITRELIGALGKGAVFVDISIDQGGCAETIRPTTLDEPVYQEEGVIHYGVCNMPAQTPRTSTYALTAATLPYIVKLADEGPKGVIKSSPALKAAATCSRGFLTNKATCEALGIPFTEVDQAF
jgi:alanine dehydrogenase